MILHGYWFGKFTVSKWIRHIGDVAYRAVIAFVFLGKLDLFKVSMGTTVRT